MWPALFRTEISENGWNPMIKWTLRGDKQALFMVIRWYPWAHDISNKVPVTDECECLADISAMLCGWDGPMNACGWNGLTVADEKVRRLRMKWSDGCEWSGPTVADEMMPRMECQMSQDTQLCHLEDSRCLAAEWGRSYYKSKNLAIFSVFSVPWDALLWNSAW